MMPIQYVKLIIWGKPFSIPVEYADSVDPEAYADLGQTIHKFIVESSNITSLAMPKVKAYIERTASAIGATAPENLFECVTPHMLLVNMDEGNILIALLCGYTYDSQNDIAILFRDGSLMEVGSQDLISWW